MVSYVCDKLVIIVRQIVVCWIICVVFEKLSEIIFGSDI